MDLKKIQRVVFDWKRTLYDPDSGQLIDGAWELLEFLQEKKIPMILIGKGGEDMNQEVERLGVKFFFQNMNCFFENYVLVAKSFWICIHSIQFF